MIATLTPVIINTEVSDFSEKKIQQLEKSYIRHDTDVMENSTHHKPFWYYLVSTAFLKGLLTRVPNINSKRNDHLIFIVVLFLNEFD